MVSPFKGYVAWIGPVLIWMYVSYFQTGFFQYFMLFLGCIVLAMTVDADETIGVVQSKVKAPTYYVAGIPLERWVLEAAVLPYAAISLIKLSAYTSTNLFAHILFWITVAMLTYVVVLILLFVARQNNFVQYIRTTWRMIKIALRRSGSKKK
ncbi:MAG: hypothetical protein ACQESE_02105 [Nanobdellota archaeon]